MYNMKIVVLDKNKDIITLQFELLNEIKSYFCKPNTHIIEYNNESISIDVKWDKYKMNYITNYLCGDLYSNPSCNDELIFKHTTKTMQSIEHIYKEYKIIFYISKIISR